MANMTLIEAKTLPSNVSSVSFTTIPQTYTDIKILVSARSTFTGANWAETNVTFNGSSSYSSMRVQGNGSTDDSYTSGSAIAMWINSANTSANTFSNAEIYIPNYTSSNPKSVSIDFTTENYAQSALMGIVAGLSTLSTAINTVTLTSINGDYVTGSTFYLYGISSAAINSTPYATGGTIYQDSTYFYHMFTSTGTLTPSQAISNVDYLVVAGGGGAGYGGGGGAGGLRCTVDKTGGGGSLPSKISLASGTGYAITVGAGGTGTSSYSNGSAGSASSIIGGAISISTVGGGAGGGTTPTTGGSGGGYGNNTTGSGAAGTSNEGYAGGAGDAPRGGGGGGGAGFNGQAGNGLAAASGGWAGNGGDGILTTIGGNATYYAGGGGGAHNGNANVNQGQGGLGGGGTGGTFGGVGKGGTDALASTGGGGGACNMNASTAGNGGSGIVIVRYAK